MTYYRQLQKQTNSLTLQRKNEYTKYNFGKLLQSRFLKKNCRVLEIGPGLGDFVIYCKSRGIKSVDIIDSDKGVRKNLRKNKLVNKEYSSIKHFMRKNTDLYDVIMMTQVLEHISINEHVLLIQKLYALLRHDGVIIITVPNIGNPLASFERYYDYTHVTAFTEHSLIQLVDLARLKNAQVYVQPFRIPPYSFINIVRVTLQWVLHKLFRMMYIINGGVYPSVLTTNITLIIEKN